MKVSLERHSHIRDEHLIKVSKLIYFLIYIAVFVLLIFTSDFGGQYKWDYVILLAGYIIVAGLLCISVVVMGADLFEPIILILVLLIGIFSVTPIILTSDGIVSIYGVEFMSGCIRATFAYILGSVAIFFGYYWTRRPVVKKTNTDIMWNSLAIVDQRKILRRMYLIWGICYLIGMSYEVLILGRSLSYMLTIGSAGQINDMTASQTPLSFLVNFTYSLIIPWLYILFRERLVLPKIITSVLMLLIYIVCGWRFIIVIMLLSAACVYYVSHNKRPRVGAVLTGLGAMLVLFTLIGGARNALRNDQDADWVVDSSAIETTLETNFNIYQPFYGVVTKYPSEYSYTYGEGMIFDTLITFYPRMLWPDKPKARDFASLRAIRNSMGNQVIDQAGMAVPNIGEIYVDFGLIGIIIIMFLYGRVLRWMVSWYRNERVDLETLIVYATAFALNFQFVIRGYMPNNFYLFVFVMWPVFVLNKKHKIRI